jgi:Ser-tRNA(Ala) deacylase AlaX
MNPTDLMYMSDMECLETTASVLDVFSGDDGKSILVLDRTIFYPQGGGQPADHGKISSASADFHVDDVRFLDGVVQHKGFFADGVLKQGDEVKLSVDANRRRFNSRLHTAGHLIDYAIERLGYKLEAGKGYHFPDSPYVEYVGKIDDALKGKLFETLEGQVNQLINDNLAISVKIVPFKELETLCGNVPPYIPTNKPARIMFVDGLHGIPCGGTHVSSTAQVGALTISSIKSKKGDTRVSYRLE